MAVTRAGKVSLPSSGAKVPGRLLSPGGAKSPKMAQRLILKSHANEVLLLIYHEGLAPSQFEWEERSSKHADNLEVSALIHRPTGYYFLFDFYGSTSEHWAEFSPASGSPLHSVHAGSWEFQRDYVLAWITFLKREIEAPDLWGAICQEMKLAEATISVDIPNTPFSPEERETILEQLDEIEAHVLDTHSLAADQAKFLKKQLSYLKESSSRLGRKDWLTLALGAVVSVAISVGPDIGRNLFQLFITAIRHVFGGTPPLSLGA